MATEPITLAITPGDPNGIGPEVTIKAVLKIRKKIKNIHFQIFANPSAFRGLPKFPKEITVEWSAPAPDMIHSGQQSGWAIESATKYVLKNPRSRALVTGPINKKQLQKGGYAYQGHTDFLGDLCKVKNPTMMLANDIFKVALVSQHCALKQVSKHVTQKQILTTGSHVAEYLLNILKIRQPKIAILGLNPHAGEEGILGDEEIKVIKPAMRSLSKLFPKAKFTGIHSADSFFGLEFQANPKERHDAILAMYHDQGLIPVKTIGFHKTVNITLGLPMIRTSVDHGTAMDRAGKGTADPGSMILAIESAISALSASHHQRPSIRK
jgi:4-hydroxythreonine-4-phosphate dehydrogenase